MEYIVLSIVCLLLVMSLVFIDGRDCEERQIEYIRKKEHMKLLPCTGIKYKDYLNTKLQNNRKE